jgi:signal transduction histidine kinase
LPFIFHRFYRADRSRSKEKVEGYGLGLSIAKRITDLHHGTISADSTPGKGSTFRIKLPMKFEVKKPFFVSI